MVRIWWMMEMICNEAVCSKNKQCWPYEFHYDVFFVFADKGARARKQYSKSTSLLKHIAHIWFRYRIANVQKKLGRIGGGNIKHLCVPAANLNYNSFQSESDRNGLLVQIASVDIPQSDVFCCAWRVVLVHHIFVCWFSAVVWESLKRNIRGPRLEARLDYNARWAAQHPTPPSF